jgi:hypothetical protein
MLLPNYDEYLIAYKERAAFVDQARAANVVARSGGAFANHLMIDGRLAGGWSRTIKGNTVLIEVAPYKKLAPGAGARRFKCGRLLRRIPRLTSVRVECVGHRSTDWPRNACSSSSRRNSEVKSLTLVTNAGVGDL